MSHHVAASSAKRESNNKTANSTNDGSELGGGGDYYKTVWNTGEESVTSVATQAGKTRLARERVASILRDTELRSSSDVEATFTSSSRGGRSSFGFGFDDVVERDDVEAASFAADDVNDDDELQLDPSRKPARNSFFKHLKQLQQARAKESSMFSDGLARDSDLGYLAGDGLVNLSDPVTSDAVGLGRSCLPTEGLEWSMSDDDDDEPILDLVGPQATARPRPSNGLRPSPQANFKVDRKAFSRRLVFKFVAAAGALLFIVCLLTFFIILAVRLINS